MRAARVLLFGGVLVTSACASEPRRPVQAPPPAVLTQAPGTPLPPGWIWPFDLRRGAAAFAQFTVFRPIDVSRLLPARGTGPCTPVEVAPNVWITPFCQPLPKLTTSSAVQRHALAFRDGAPPPLAVDLRATGRDGPVKNQQMVGVCWSFAISTVMDNALRRAGRQDVVAPLHVLASDTWDDLWAGKPGPPLVGEASWPYDPVKACKLNTSNSEVWCGQAYHVQPGSWQSDPLLTAELARANSTGSFRAVHAESFSASPTNPDEIAASIAEGRAVYVGMDIDTRAWSYSSGVIPDWSATDGAHGVALVGYRPFGGGRQFLVHNSWGSEWAEGGYAWISDAMLRAHTREAFVLEVETSGSLPVPKPTPLPTGGTPTFGWPFPWPGAPNQAAQCPAQQLRDVVFGVCVAACANGAPPVAGLCAPGAPAPSGGSSGGASSSCAAGQVRDWLTQQCAAQCPNGLPPAGGLCAPW